MLVVLDCNIWITLALNRQSYYIADISNNGIIIASCTELRNEITTVLSRPKFNKLFSESDIIKAIELHDLVTTNYRIGKNIKATSDPKDDYLFALSVKAKADYLVTGDKLLLEVIKYKETELITLAQFKKIANR
jgi:putative PIN family toxin of toxin-antitoxin system